jgi:hypothetical protein
MFQSRKNKTQLIQLVRFQNEDVERSEIVKKVIEMYDYKENEFVPIHFEKKNNGTFGDAALIPIHHLRKLL